MAEKYTQLKFTVRRTETYTVNMVIDNEEGVSIATAKYAILTKIADIPSENWARLSEDKFVVTLTDGTPAKPET